jgi:hypothetical protein
MRSVVPSGPTAPAAGGGGRGAGGGGARAASTETLYALAREVQQAADAEAEAAAAEALQSYGDAVKQLLADGDQRYQEVVAQLKIMEREITALRAVRNTR